MAGELLKPVNLKFRGLDADSNIMDAALLGRSIQGTSRLYTSILLYWFQNEIPERIVSPPIRVLAGPPKDGSLWYVLYIMMAHGELALYPTLLWEMADLAVPQFVKAIIARKSGRSVDLEKALDVIADQQKVIGDQSRHIAEQSTRALDFMERVHDGHMSDKQQMFAVIDKLATNNSRSR